MKMVATVNEKKRWISKIYNESQETRIDTNISWSDSDEEQPPLKKTDTNVFFHKNKSNWINLKITPVSTVQDQELESLTRDDPFGSPIISQIKLEEQSPVLTEINQFLSKEQSPVLSRSKVVRKIKWRSRRKKEEVIENEESPVKSQIIIVSPSQSPIETNNISPVKPEFYNTYYIDSASSQNSSEVILDVSGPGSRASPNQPSLRRKRHKKGSLCSQIHKAISLQTSTAAIWQHEKFLEKSKEINGVGSDLEFCVIDHWFEYGCDILKCQCNINLKLFSDFTEIDNDIFLLISSSNAGIRFEVNLSYQISPPYSTRVIVYESENLLCVFNASRIIRCKE